MFYVLGIFMTLFLILLLLIKKNKSHADKILFTWLIIISVTQLFHYLTYTKAIYKYPHWLGVNLPLPIIIGLFLYFYTKEITGNKLTYNRKTLLHFLPALLLILLAIPFYRLTGEEKINVFENQGLGFEWYILINSTTIAVSGLVYAVLSLLLLKRYKVTIQDNFSNTEKKNLQWLQLLSIGFGLIWILSAIFDNNVIFSSVVLFVLSIAIFGINQLNIFNSNSIISEKTISKSQNIQEKSIPKNEKYSKSGLSKETATEIYNNLTKLMHEDSLYKNKEITLLELSKQLDTHPNYLSQVINEMEGKNFYNYINTIRINEFIKIASLPENKKYTMLSLALDCGFSSKSTFNKHFKSVTGKTPTAFFKSTEN